MQWIALRSLPHIIALLSCVLTGACETFRIPPPGGTAARIGDIPATQQSLECPIFVVTDREPDPATQSHILFRNSPGYLVKAATGSVEIDQGAKTPFDLWRHSLDGQGISPKLSDLDPIADLWGVFPTRSATTNPDRSPGTRSFGELINQRLDATGAEDLVVFVHGYNADLADNAGILAALWHYSGRKFVPIAYEWPSEVRLIAYAIDKQNAARSTRSLRLLLETLARQTKAKRIHILAHSAGSALVVSALQQLRLREYDRSAVDAHAYCRLGNVVLAAPDVDTAEYLNTVMDGMLDLPERLTIYMSSQDLALRLSRFVFGDNRLGYISSKHAYSAESAWLTKLADSNAIDVAPALKRYPQDWIGHSYYYRNPIVSQDVIRALLTDESPENRGLKLSQETPGIWLLPESLP